MPRSLLVVAIGGNALLRRGQPAEIDIQRANVAAAARVLAGLAADHRLVITHGNGPQVGLLARQSEALEGALPVPFDVLGAESDGLIGYLLAEQLSAHVPAARVSVLLTRVEVRPDDPAFTAPSKPIGAMLSAADAADLARSRGWAVAPDGDGWRRVIASPDPLRVVEVEAVAALVAAGQVVVCAGGGGIPVASVDGLLRGVEAVIDKDLTTALLAQQLEADELVILTDVDAVYRHWGESGAVAIHRATPSKLRSMPWAAGSMGPKIEAACRFVEATGHVARIGSLSAASAVLDGAAGTTVSPAR